MSTPQQSETPAIPAPSTSGAPSAAPAARPRVLIIGSGFGGLEAARALAGAAVEVTLVDKTNHHLFQPLLYQVATAGLSAPAIAGPVRQLFRKQANLLSLMAEVVDIDAQAGQVQLLDGTRLAYDHLIVAAGASHSYFGHDEWAPFAPGLKTLEDAFNIRRRILFAFEAAERETDAVLRAQLLNFVVVGAGPTGVEMAGTMAEIAHQTLQGEFRRIDPATARVLLLEGGRRVLQAMPEGLSEKARQQLMRLGVEVRLNTRVTHIDAGGLQAESPSSFNHGAVHSYRLDSRCIIWAAGVAASPLGAVLQVRTGCALDRAGRVLVQPDLSLEGFASINVIGDLAAAHSHRRGQEPRPVPGVSPAAKQMGRLAAANVLRRIAGYKARPFRYSDYGNLATIGRNSAVVDLTSPMGAIRFSGYFAWLFWLFAHIYFLIGFRNRLVVMIDWASAYWSFRRYARVVAGGDKPDTGA